MRQKTIRPTFDQVQRAMNMWRGADTAAIAVDLALPEPVIAGVVTTMRELEFAMHTNSAAPEMRAAA